MNLENAALLVTMSSGILTVLSLLKQDAAKQTHVSMLTIVAALLFALCLGWFIVSQPPHLHPAIVLSGVLLSAVAGRIFGELGLPWTSRRAQMGSFHLLLITLSTLVLLKGVFWITWAVERPASSSLPKQQANPAATTLQASCPALVRNDLARASTYLSNTQTHISALSQEELARNSHRDTTQLSDKLIACSSTVSDSTTRPEGTPYIEGCVIYSFSRGARYFHEYGLFYEPSSSSWLMDTAYWKDPHVSY